ncbi:MAG: peptidylprolyl isomerase [Candidatus Tectomicrobia bacterium]|nr:peptidylprolyl isomerase [Candidatus Tectomicrobia bacterium]
MKLRRKLRVRSTNASWRVLLIIVFTAFSLCYWDSPPGQALMIDRIVARVNDDVITLSELQEEGLPLFERLRANYAGKELEYQVQHAEREFLDQLILRRLQLQYASQIGINASENEINAALKDVLNRNNLTQEALTDLLTREGLTLQDYKDRLREQIILARLMNQAVRSRVSVDASEVEAYYKTHQDEFSQPAQARVRHIFFRIDPDAAPPQVDAVRERASRVLREARNGGDFGELARRYSEDATAANGGDLGVIKRGQAVPEFEEVIFALKEGDVSEVLRTPNGLHIVKIDAFTKGSEQPFPEIKAEIERRLLQDKIKQRFQDWTNELKDRAFIEITLHEGHP